MNKSIKSESSKSGNDYMHRDRQTHTHIHTRSYTKNNGKADPSQFRVGFLSIISMVLEILNVKISL